MQATGRSQNRIVLRSPWQNLETFALASQIGATPKGKNLREQILSFWSSPYFENDELFPLKAVPYGKEAKKNILGPVDISYLQMLYSRTSIIQTPIIKNSQ